MLSQYLNPLLVGHNISQTNRDFTLLSYSYHSTALSWLQLEVPGLSSASMLEVGPVALTFELPKVTATGLQIRFLRLSPIQPGPSQRWVRYSTLSDSYTIRVWPSSHRSYRSITIRQGHTNWLTSNSGEKKGIYIDGMIFDLVDVLVIYFYIKVVDFHSFLYFKIFYFICINVNTEENIYHHHDWNEKNFCIAIILLSAYSYMIWSVVLQRRYLCHS